LVTEGVSDQYIVGVQTRAETASEDTSLYTAADELVCYERGHAIGLPIPAGVEIKQDREPYHASLDFNIAGHKLPPADTVKRVEHEPILACEILAFDVCVANRDRYSATWRITRPLAGRAFSTISTPFYTEMGGKA
jgi:hypothetical protein